MDKPESKTYVRGIGQSEVGRRLNRDELDLTIEAALRAIEDAGLKPSDIDGLAAYPGAMAAPPGFAGPGTPSVQDALRLNLGWHHGGQEGPAQVGATIAAVLAVAAGLCKHALVYRTVTEATAQGTGGRAGIGVGGGGSSGSFRVGAFMQWNLPYGAYSAANWIGMMASRYMHETGMTQEQLGWIAVNGRRNAALNPNAVYREPLTHDDYMASRVITTPFRLYDCDAPCDGATALVVSHVDTAGDAPHPIVRFEAVGTALRGRPSWDQFDDLTTFACRDAAAQMWTRTDLKPGDVQMAQLYDGFSWLSVAWLEALKLVEPGGAGAFLEGGENIRRDGGVLPLNTSGGQLSAGRLHGYGHLHESVLQLMGRAGDRQIPGSPQVAAMANGGGPIAGCVLLTRD